MSHARREQHPYLQLASNNARNHFETPQLHFRHHSVLTDQNADDSIKR